MLHTAVGRTLGAVIVLGAGVVGVVVWRVLGAIAKASRWAG